MSQADVTLADFIAMPDYRREHYRKYAKTAFPPDSELPPPPVYSNSTKRLKPCFVYFIQAGDGPIKIGVATDTKRRLAMLQCGNHEPLTLLAATPGGANVEAALHYRFREHRQRGEWFAPHPDLLTEIDRLAQEWTQ